VTPAPATFGAWMELRPGHGRQPDPAYYAERLEEAALVERLGLAAVWGSEHHAVEDGHAREGPGVGAPRPLEHEGAVRVRRRVREPDADVHAFVRVRVQEGLHFTEVMCQPNRGSSLRG